MMLRVNVWSILEWLIDILQKIASGFPRKKSLSIAVNVIFLSAYRRIVIEGVSMVQKGAQDNGEEVKAKTLPDQIREPLWTPCKPLNYCWQIRTKLFCQECVIIITGWDMKTFLSYFLYMIENKIHSNIYHFQLSYKKIWYVFRGDTENNFKCIAFLYIQKQDWNTLFP